MVRPARSRRRPGRFVLYGCIFFCLGVWLVGCGGETDPLSVLDAKFSIATPQELSTPMNTPLGTQKCPAAVSTNEYWQTFITGGPKVDKVICGVLISGGSDLQAVVRAGLGGDYQLFVFNQITTPQPVLLWKTPNTLFWGDMLVSQVNTLLSFEIDNTSTANAGKPIDQWVHDVQREYQWNSEKKTFEQIAFPGIFPHLTRYQAEKAAPQMTSDPSSWYRDANKVAIAFSQTLLRWPQSTSVRTISGGGKQDVEAVVAVQHPSTKVMVRFSLQKLGLQKDAGWEVVYAETPELTLSNPHPLSVLPYTCDIAGSAPLKNQHAGNFGLYNRAYITVFQSDDVLAVGADNHVGSFSGNFTYSSYFTQNLQDGVFFFFSPDSQGNDGAHGAILFKVLIGATPTT